MGEIQISRSGARTSFLFVFIFGYVVLGAIVFILLEGSNESIERNNLRKIRQNFLEKSQCVTDADLEEFIVKIVEANNRGVSAVANVSSESNWSFGQSIFFTGTVLTTIGYGRVTPLSEGGKIFCIVYALIGIPLTLILLAALVERLMVFPHAVFRILVKKFGEKVDTLRLQLINVVISFLILIIVAFLVPAAVFMWLEDNWNYLDALYYCFISMTTIGLGDYIPGDDPNQPNRTTYKILTTIYLFAGLLFMMVTLASLSEIPQLNLGFHFHMQSDESESGSETQQLYTAKTSIKYTEPNLTDDPKTSSTKEK